MHFINEGSSPDSTKSRPGLLAPSHPGFDVDSLPAVFRNFKGFYGSRPDKVKAGTMETGDFVESR
jgi:hypothetical protein